VSPPDTVLSVADLPIRDTILAVYAGQAPVALARLGRDPCIPRVVACRHGPEA
jgi:hypothetical protein